MISRKAFITSLSAVVFAPARGTAKVQASGAARVRALRDFTSCRLSLSEHNCDSWSFLFTRACALAEALHAIEGTDSHNTVHEICQRNRDLEKLPREERLRLLGRAHGELRKLRP